MERFVRRNYMRFSCDWRAVMWSRTGRNEHCFGTYTCAGRKTYSVLVFWGCTASDNLNMVALERCFVGRLQRSDLVILAGDQRGPIKLRIVERPAIPSGIFKLVGKTRGIHQKLFWNAASDHAGAADAIFFSDHYACAIASRDSRS